jgi:eukaryotic-like serine/threonine-protein kinase
MPLAAGTRLAQYEIVAPLGSGGMGEVYRARDLRLGRDVAIKVMGEHIAADPEMRQRFETEARAIASLSHPSVLSIYELLGVDGRPAAVMELLEGQTLRHRLERGAIPWRDAIEIAAAVADGLAAAHTKGVVHRDLKPENIFLTGDGLVKVLDFGLALRRLPVAAGSGEVPTVQQTLPGTVLGTFGYMSPEQVLGEQVDGRSDVFAAGCVLYEMLTGRRLFTGVTPQEVVANLLHDSVAELSRLDSQAPAELQAIVRRCVERNPARRFDSARDLSMALRALLTGSGRVPSGSRARARGKSLAILPMINSGADPAIEYLIDGITESIINSLSQLPGLRVVPRSLVFRYKGLQADPATVGLALNARTILTGRVVQRDNVLNIQVELVDTLNESQLWGEQFRQHTGDLMTVQEEIAWQISEALRLKLTGAQKKKLRRRYTVNPEAHQEYLRGRYHWNQWTADSFRRAREHFERAIAHDPEYALAFAGLGDTLGALAYYGLLPQAEGFPRAHAAATRALELDPKVADAHVTLALCLLFHDWDWPCAEREIKAALKLNAKLAVAHSIYALILSSSGRHDEALEEARTGRSLEPLSAFGGMGVCWALHFAGRFAEVRDEALRVLEFVPGLQEAGNVLMNAYEQLGDYEQAAARASQQPCWGVPIDGGELLAAFREGGAAGYWRARLDLLDRVPAASRPPSVDLQYAAIHVKLGQHDRALEHLQRLVDAHAGGAVFAAADALLAPLFGDSRFQALARRIGAPVTF